MTLAAPKVSVCVVTYNQAAWIGECLESLLDQDASFPYEIVVADDASTDNTAQLLADFAERHPGIVRVLSQRRNVGALANFLAAHDTARGDYVAHMDGDDRALPSKLRKQADFLDHHPECGFVAHDVVRIAADDGRTLASSFVDHEVPEVSDLPFLVEHGCFFTHSSKMYRRALGFPLDRAQPFIDFCIHVEHAARGRIGYLREVLGAYRVMPGSISSVGSSFYPTGVRAHQAGCLAALRHGVAPSVVFGQLTNFRYVQAMLCLRAGRTEMFSELIGIDARLRPYASPRHRLLAQLASSTRLAGVLTIAYDWIGRHAAGRS